MQRRKAHVEGRGASKFPEPFIEPQSRFGGKLLGIRVNLSRKLECGSGFKRSSVVLPPPQYLHIDKTKE